jgi:hypothetical protein
MLCLNDITLLSAYIFPDYIYPVKLIKNKYYGKFRYYI